MLGRYLSRVRFRLAALLQALHPIQMSNERPGISGRSMSLKPALPTNIGVLAEPEMHLQQIMQTGRIVRNRHRVAR
jgi:hypothetical protein